MPSPSSKPRFFYRLLQSLTFLTAVYLLAGYAMGYTLWWKHWIVGFWLLAMPLGMGLLALLTVAWFLADVRRAWFPFLVLLAGWPFWQRTIGLHSTPELTRSGKKLEVITFNASTFRVGDHFEVQNMNRSKAIFRWLEQTQADILCLQEAYNWKNERLPEEYYSSSLLARAGYRYAVTETRSYPYKAPFPDLFAGVVLFSRHPVVSAQYTSFKTPNGINGLVVADIRKGPDTLRVINLHLMSMGVRVGKVMKAPDSRAAKSETRNILHKLKEGFIAHDREMDPVIKAIRNSPYPVILCGDFNEVPTGLSYSRTRRYLKNSFEEAGKGFGFTLNRSPWFIRIDNQFHSNHFTAVRHEVVKSVTASDHFPVRVEYRY